MRFWTRKQPVKVQEPSRITGVPILRCPKCKGMEIDLNVDRCRSCGTIVVQEEIPVTRTRTAPIKDVESYADFGNGTRRYVLICGHSVSLPIRSVPADQVGCPQCLFQSDRTRRARKH